MVNHVCIDFVDKSADTQRKGLEGILDVLTLIHESPAVGWHEPKADILVARLTGLYP